MPTVVDVPNVGEVEFPDSMQPQEIQAALQKTVRPPVPKSLNSQSEYNLRQTPFLETLRHTPIVESILGKSQVEREGRRDFGVPITAPADIIRGLMSPGTPGPQIPLSTPDQNAVVAKELGKVGEVGMAASNLGKDFANTVIHDPASFAASSVEGVTGRLLGLLFGVTQTAQLPSAIGTAAQVIKDPTASLQQKVEAGGQAAETGLFAGAGLSGAAGVTKPMGEWDFKNPSEIANTQFLNQLRKRGQTVSGTSETVPLKSIEQINKYPWMQEKKQIPDTTGIISIGQIPPKQLAKIKEAKVQPEYKQVEPEEAKTKQIPAPLKTLENENQTQLQAIQTLKPALKEDTGKVISGELGQTHADILQDAAKKGALNDVLAIHGFVDEKGNFLNRRQASDLIGEKEPLQSEKLIELQKNVPKQIEEAKQTPTFPTPEKRAAVSLGLDKPSTAGDVARHIVSKTNATPQQKEFAAFLDRHFSHILDFAGVDPGPNPYGGRASYIYSGPDSHKIFLDLKQSPHAGVDTFLHEAAHAAMHWVYENPSNEAQRLAKGDIDKLMGMTVQNLPKAVKEFFPEFQKQLLRKPQMSYDEIQNMFKSRGLNVEKWYKTLYALQDGSEFIAGVFSDQGFRDFLDNIRVENKDSIFRRVYSAIMSALGIKPGTALEKTFDTFMRFGEGSRDALPGQLERVRKRFVGEVGVKNMPQLPSEEKGGLPVEDVIWLGDTLFTDMRGPKKWRESVQQKLNQIAGFSAPKTIASSRDAGNALVRYASARIAAPDMARAAASEVAGEHWNDKPWMDKFGAVLVEDRLRAIRETFIENGNMEKAQAVRHIWEQEDSPIKTDAEFKAALKDPEIQAALGRFEKIIQQPAAARQRQVGGKIAASGPESGAFVNLKALQDAEGEDITDYALSGGSRKGDLTNPLKRGSVFNKQASGTARKYDFNFRSIAERMVRGNYEESTKRDLYDAYTKAGLSRAEPAEGFQKITIDKGRGQTENRYFRHDIATELRQAMQTDSPVEKGARQFLINRLTDAQLVGPVDVTVHIRNMFSAIAGSQGGGVSVMADLARKIPGIRGLDTFVRVAKAMKDSYLNSPEVQKELARIAEIGAGRGEVKHVGALQRILPTGRIVQALDKAGRLTMSRMYDNLIERGWAADTEEGRREFVNKMGQYNSRLMGRVEAYLKETGVAPFIVAGKNFNRLALQRLTLNPGIAAANPEAALKMKLVDAVGLVGTLIAIPMVFNYYNTGSIWGRPGIHPGALDLGGSDEKGRPKQLDLVQNILVRRGLRNVGAEAAYKDAKQGRGESDMIHDAFMDMARGYASPYEGPAVGALVTTVTGRDRSGYLVSENPDSLGANLLAALKNANPTIAKMFQAQQEGTSKTSASLSPLTQAFGLSVGRRPSLFEQEQQIPGLEKQSLSERAKTQKALQHQDKTDMTVQQKLQMSMDEAKRSKQVEVQLNQELKPDTQKWLKSQRLEVPGFAEYLTQTGVRVYLLPKEREEYMKIMVASYEDAIRKAKPFVERQESQDGKEKVLSEFIRQAHGVARNKMRNLIGKEQE